MGVVAGVGRDVWSPFWALSVLISLSATFFNVPWNVAKGAEEKDEMAKSSSSAIVALPNQILLEIFLRLPAKSLVSSRLVCRSWLHLISDPYFSNIRMERAPNELFIRPWNHEYDLTSLYMPDLQGDFGKLNDVFDLPRLFSVNFDEKSKRLYMVNCCNGFICYNGPSSDRFTVVWNPITREFLISPAPMKETDWKIRISHGFGFSPKANEYKLLRMVHCYDLEHNPIADTAYVITFREGEFWRSVEDKPYWLPNPLSPTFLGNSIHWLCNDDSCSETIASFDFDNEQFCEVLPPPHLIKCNIATNKAKPNSIYDLRLGILEGRLCISADTQNTATDIWVMKEYGVQDSWTKAFSIQRYYPINTKENYEVMQCLESGEVVLSLNGTHLFLYDRVRGTKTLLGSSDCRLEMVVFKPTLCLLKDATRRGGAKLENNVKSGVSPMFTLGRRVVENPPWWTGGGDKCGNKLTSRGLYQA